MCDNEYYDVLIVGGGVIGCAVLRAVTLAGWKCILVEAEPDLLSHASGANSGIMCTGVDASPGTLERALIRDSNSMFKIYCHHHNIPMRTCGSLVCSWPWDDGRDTGTVTDTSTDTSADTTSTGNDNDNDHYSRNDNFSSVEFKLHQVYQESYEANDIHVTKLSPSQILSPTSVGVNHNTQCFTDTTNDTDNNYSYPYYEPNISNSIQGAIHIPGEIVVDSWLYSISLALHAKENGGVILTNVKFDENQSQFDQDMELWNVVLRQTNQSLSTTSSSKCEKTMKLNVKTIVNAAGVWSDTIHNIQCSSQHQQHQHTTFTSKPRRGQYRIYSSNPKTIITHPIQPIPTQYTKGIFIFSTIYNQLVVGPTAKDQESKNDKSIDDVVSQELDLIIQRVIPNINVKQDYIGDYVGIRPGTDKRDYQIHLVAKRNWIVVGGIRSTGLTASLGIGNYVMRLLHSILPTSSCSSSDDSNKKRLMQTTPLPPVEDLIANYQRRQDGYVDIHGCEYKVTHPLTRIGWERYKKGMNNNN